MRHHQRDWSFHFPSLSHPTKLLPSTLHSSFILTFTTSTTSSTTTTSTTTLSHHLPSTAHITAINMSLSCMSLSPPTSPRPHRIERRDGREEKTQKQQLIHLPLDLPPVKPSAIALGTLFNHAASLAVLGPVFGDTYRRAMQANSNEEFFKSKEAASAGAAWGTSLIGSAVQSYGVGALINATGTLSYKGAAYLGALIFAASSAPSVCHFYHFHHKSSPLHH